MELLVIWMKNCLTLAVVCVVEYIMRLYRGCVCVGLMRLDILCVYGDMRLRLKDALAMGCV